MSEVRVEIPRKSVARSGAREVIVEVPSDLELSEGEIEKVASAAQNQIVEVIRGIQAKQLAARSTIRIRIEIEIVE